MPTNQEIFEIVAKGLDNIKSLSSALQKVTKDFTNVANSQKKLAQVKTTDTFKQITKDGLRFEKAITGIDGKLTDVTTKTEEWTAAGGKNVITSKLINGEMQVTARVIDEVTKTQTALSRTTVKNTKDGGTLTSTFNKLRDGTTNVTRAYEGLDAQGNKFNKTTTRIAGNLRDVSTTTNKTASNLGRLEDNTKKTTKAAENFGITWRGVIRVVAGSAIARGVGSLLRSFREGISTSAEFEKRISEIRTISQDSQQDFNSWAEQVRILSDELGNPITDVAEGVYQTLSNQIAKGADATKFMSEAQRLALITVADSTEAVQALTGTLNAYSQSADQARGLSNKFFKSIELGRFRLEDVAESIGRVAILGKQLGVSQSELLGSLSELTIKGVNAAEAMTFLRGIFINLIKPTEDMKVFIKNLGFETAETAIKTIGFTKLLQELGKAAEASGTPLTFMGELFGRIRGVIGATGLAFGNLEETVKEISNSTKSANKAFELMQESAGFKLQRELERVKNVFVADFGQEFLRTISGINDALGGFASKLELVAPLLINFSKFLAVASIVALINAFGLLAAKITSAGTVLNSIFLGPAGVFAAITTAAFIATQKIIGHFENNVKDLDKLNQEEVTDYKRAQAEKTNIFLNHLAEQEQATKGFLSRQADLLSEGVSNFANDLARRSIEAKGREGISKLLFDLSEGIVSPDKRVGLIEEKLNDAFKVLVKYQDQAREGVQVPGALDTALEINVLLQELEKLGEGFDKAGEKRDKFFSGSLKKAGTDGASLPRITDTFKRQSTNKEQREINSTREINKLLQEKRQKLFDIISVIDQSTKKQGQLSSLTIEQLKEELKLQQQRILAIQNIATKINITGTEAAKNNQNVQQSFNDVASSVINLDSALEKVKTRSKFLTLEGFQFSVGLETLKTIQKEIQIAQEQAGKGLFKEEDIAKIEARIKAFRDQFQQGVRKGIFSENEFVEIFPQLKALEERFKATINSISNAKISSENFVTFQETLARLNNEIGILGQNFATIDVTGFVDENSGKLVENYTRQVDNLARKVGELRALIFQANNEAAAARAAAGANYSGGHIRRFATGGSVGRDSILARLNPGEFVTNAKQTRKFLPQLTSQNSNAVRFASGGQVTNNQNIGDINVNVEGSNSTPREIAAAIRRELIRGTARLQ